MREIAFIERAVPQRDIDLLIADETGKIDCPTGFITPGESMAHLMQRAGAFTSVGEARRNGWNKPIPSGFSQHRIGKRLLVTVLTA